MLGQKLITHKEMVECVQTRIEDDFLMIKLK
jgi:hypothetical protein